MQLALTEAVEKSRGQPPFQRISGKWWHEGNQIAGVIDDDRQPVFTAACDAPADVVDASDGVAEHAVAVEELGAELIQVSARAQTLVPVLTGPHALLAKQEAFGQQDLADVHV